MTTPYALTAFREGLSGIEALVTLDGEPVTVIAGIAPYDLAPARTWAPHHRGRFGDQAARHRLRLSVAEVLHCINTPVDV